MPVSQPRTWGGKWAGYAPDSGCQGWRDRLTCYYRRFGVEMGGYSADDRADHNSVFMYGGRVDTIYGGYTNDNAAYNNTVHLIGAGTLKGSALTITGTVYGGVGRDVESFGDNCIEIYGSDITAGSIQGVQLLNFHLVDGLASTTPTPMMTLTSEETGDALTSQA